MKTIVIRDGKLQYETMEDEDGVFHRLSLRSEGTILQGEWTSLDRPARLELDSFGTAYRADCVSALDGESNVWIVREEIVTKIHV